MSTQIKNENLFGVIRAPHISEKSARLGEHNQYVFEVAPDADKSHVKAAVEAMFNVKDKTKSFRNRAGSRKGWRKAYVRLSEGQTIDVTAKP
jgi:large subunit ribosomal protein L23